MLSLIVLNSFSSTAEYISLLSCYPLIQDSIATALCMYVYVHMCFVVVNLFIEVVQLNVSNFIIQKHFLVRLFGRNTYK